MGGVKVDQVGEHSLDVIVELCNPLGLEFIHDFFAAHEVSRVLLELKGRLDAMQYAADVSRLRGLGELYGVIFDDHAVDVDAQLRWQSTKKTDLAGHCSHTG